MIPAKFMGFFAKSFQETLFYRLRGRPQAASRPDNPAFLWKPQPGWPLLFETVVRTMRRNMLYCAGLPPEAARSFQERLALPFRHSITREATTLDGVSVEWFRPKKTSRSGVLVYLHGGSYLFGSTKTHAELIARLSVLLEIPALGVNYRLAPEHTLREAREDVVTVLRYLRTQNLGPAVITGDSAGGGLCLSTMLSLREQPNLMPKACAMIAPWVDMRCIAPSYTENEGSDWGTREALYQQALQVAKGDALEGPLYCPLYEDLKGLPPFLVHVGSAEMQRDDGVSLVERARAKGVEATVEVWPEMIHNFHLFADFAKTPKLATASLVQFLLKHLA